MGCGSCSSGGCSIKSGSSKTGSCSGCAGGGCNILSTTDWLGDIMDWVNESYRNLVEVRFKAGRKEFFINKTGKRLYTGDGVMVETGAGYHLGFVSLQGESPVTASFCCVSGSKASTRRFPKRCHLMTSCALSMQQGRNKPLALPKMTLPLRSNWSGNPEWIV